MSRPPCPALDRGRPRARAAAWLALGLLAATARADDAPGPAVLQLVDGGTAAGELLAAPKPGVVRWKGASFVGPFDFDAAAVGSIVWPPPAGPVRSEGTFAIELAGGDLLFGDLAALDGDRAVVDVPRLGRLTIERNRLRALQRWVGGDELVYHGPRGLSGWSASPEGAWRDDGGLPATDRPAALLRGDVGLPARAAITLELSWNRPPSFVLALGVDDDSKSIERAFRFEVWKDVLVALRENDREADVGRLATIEDGPGRIELRAYLDQEAGRLLVYGSDGRPLADLSLPERKPTPRAAIALRNLSGDVRLDRLLVRRWNGTPPRGTDDDRPRLIRTDGSVVAGPVRRFDAEAGEFMVEVEGEDDGEHRVSAKEVDRLVFPLPPEEEPRPASLTYQDGLRLSGEFRGATDDALEFAVPGIEGTIRAPRTGLQALGFRREAKPADDSRKVVRLEVEGATLRGELVDAVTDGDATCLAWKPAGSRTSSPLRAGVAGRIVFRKTSPPKPVDPAAPPTPAARVIGAVIRNIPQPAPSASVKPTLYLRTGDNIPAEVVGIDEQGVRFKSPLSSNTLVPHDKVKAAVLAGESARTVRLNQAKRDRLLTLPRIQKNSPPTQLIRSRNGDYLRGRIVGMDAQSLNVEVRLEEKRVSRDLVARIIWLHPDEIEDDDKPASQGDGANRVQAVRSDGVRLTFRPERVEDGAILGESDVLGRCRVKLDEVDELLIGGAIESAAAKLAYQQWTLRNAPEPKADAESEGGSSGMESALVGKAAPDFTLDLLDGKPFHLADARGSVVILDFWATWCGPCLQAMPQVEQVAGEFKDRGVRLIAVNLEEAPDRIRAMLERHKLGPTVALDRDGVVAQKYGANAIPQTVIVGPDGQVARLFVGGGPRFDEQLRTALQAVLDGDQPQ